MQLSADDGVDEDRSEADYSKDVCDSLTKNDDILAAIHTRKTINRNHLTYKKHMRRMKKKNHSMAIGQGDLLALDYGPDKNDLDPINSDLNCVLQKIKTAAIIDTEKDPHISNSRLQVRGSGQPGQNKG